jgi:hypothetical protein
MPWKQEGETVVLSMSVEDWKTMLFVLGFALGALPPNDFRQWIGLLKRINEGNPDFTPYEIRAQPPDRDRDLVTGHGDEYDEVINMRRPLTEAEIQRLLGLARQGE